MDFPVEPVKVVVVVASVRSGRLAPDVAGWLTAVAGLRDDLVLDVVDVADHELPGSLDAQDPVAVALRPRLASAEAFVVIVPEYNRSVPGPVKTLIDSFQTEWEAKPVGFVSYGLSLVGGVRAVEHLRQIFAEFHAVGMKDAVIFPRILEHYDAQGRFPAEPEGAEAAAKLMLDQLLWWARALRDAKRARPYGS
ncbi:MULTISPECIES: NADPH-dependent FMN reductase [unclassified Streptomyces]|uniref:NADPH-dependent FMN reductase n=1 Tax=unclassified Streptomyces TaxID=2593676 RepID=UPI00225555E0|nr:MULTISPECIES: NAD(P)H-dependent oxidoreductase [unclassified Streptomyces]WSP58523.1 NAD(P)H-dependent oxidoreductase [Streptomyces sp. NBC_01241]WSU20900.1 NAD(P)H-dependent oxidoreductase [Streptomyces sp. NBC_01108]MCX4790289.1 NAD(P)H-dependent oxidoreductase [Streptomyces sp. NBC_01221]MCX4793983.1 NAD(P)H-dependent oxidoreductase [Streptomyces sp. NBC_01242]WSJ35394.1 NAD(P)H-dependent oxidoreductase [Streptomyces sp. NBC_01321]